MRNQSLDMDEYIKQRITEISDADERGFAKEALLKGLLPVFRTVNERYQELEERVRREVASENAQFCVMTTLIRRKDYDPTNRFWFPVCDSDVQEGEGVCRRIYFQGNEKEKRAFEKKPYLDAADPSGEIHRVGIRRAENYRKAIEALYHIFVYNRVPWNTVNTGDLDRFYEIYPLEENQSTEEWEISYGEWKDRIHTDYIPLWNIEKFYFHCMKFMVPCLDGKYYEHELNLEDYDPDSGYMVEGNEDILSVRYERRKIVMTSMKETFQKWCAYRFGSRIDTDSYGYHHKILGNCKREQFADCFAAKYGQRIHSKTEIFRIVEELDVGEYIRLLDCRIREQEQEGSFCAGMNWFIREELFPMDTRRILELQFALQASAEKEDCYAEDMLRYAISQVQLLLDEYKCVGVLL